MLQLYIPDISMLEARLDNTVNVITETNEGVIGAVHGHAKKNEQKDIHDFVLYLAHKSIIITGITQALGQGLSLDECRIN